MARNIAFRLLIPQDYSGRIIGKGGERISRIRAESAATLKIDAAENQGFRTAHVSGTREQVITCVGLCFNDEASDAHGEMEVRMFVPSAVVGGIIGRQGATIKAIRENTGATLRIEKTPAGPQEQVRSIDIGGSISQIRLALQEIVHRVDEEGGTGMLLAPPSAGGPGGCAMGGMGGCGAVMRSPGGMGGVGHAMGGGMGMGAGHVMGGGMCGGGRMGACGAAAANQGFARGGQMSSMAGAPGLGFGRAGYGGCGGCAGGFQGCGAVASLVGGSARGGTKRGVALAERPHGVLVFELANDLAGLLIGQRGATISRIRRSTGAQCHIREACRPGGGERVVAMDGTQEQVSRCIDEAFAALQAPDRGSEPDRPIELQLIMPSGHMGAVIGQKGANITSIRQTGVRIKVDEGYSTAKDSERVAAVSGTAAQVSGALKMVADFLYREGKVGVEESSPAKRERVS